MTHYFQQPNNEYSIEIITILFGVGGGICNSVNPATLLIATHKTAYQPLTAASNLIIMIPLEITTIMSGCVGVGEL